MFHIFVSLKNVSPLCFFKVLFIEPLKTLGHIIMQVKHSNFGSVC